MAMPGGNNPSCLFGDDTRIEGHPPFHNVFRRVRAEQHAVVNGVGEINNDMMPPTTELLWEGGIVLALI